MSRHGCANDRNKRIYNIWCGMRQRCNNPRHPAARWYHEKGIRLCSEWETDFSEFQKWSLENGYFDGASIDRIDPNKGYNPENCRWITIEENRNRAIRNAKNQKPTRRRKHLKKWVPNKDKAEERILNLLNLISSKKGKDFAEGLVEGINLAAPRKETREELIEKMRFFSEKMDDEQLRLVVAFMRGLTR